MRFDLVSIFPEYFAPLELSLLGKARQQGKVDFVVHNLRDWAEGKHLSVDDSPFGGGAGMVMRPDTWGRCLDQVLAEAPAGERTVLAIPTPAGLPLTQRVAEDLATAQQIVVACGRYEGIDARVAEHYRAGGVEVLEFSLGDYVLNGGEVAALALVESVGRLVGGVVGNPESLVEESHSQAGLLEYPVYTAPREWRGLAVPEVLTGGNHGVIRDWRRACSLERTAKVRPDLLAAIEPEQLDMKDRETLAAAGWLIKPRPAQVTFRLAREEDAPELAALAARTFPDACPPGFPMEEAMRFVAEQLSAAAFGHYLADSEYIVLVAEVEGALRGYTLSVRTAPADLRKAPEGSAYLSKCYTDSDYRGSGLTGALLNRTINEITGTWQSPAIALATNRLNVRAAKFYKRHGFKAAGRRIFLVGKTENVDDVFVLKVTGL